MEATTKEAVTQKPQTMERLPAKRPRKSRSIEEARYFLAKEGSSPSKPELGEEAQNESGALIQAFQSKERVIYVVMSYQAEAEVQGGAPVLVKRPLQK